MVEGQYSDIMTENHGVTVMGRLVTWFITQIVSVWKKGQYSDMMHHDGEQRGTVMGRLVYHSDSKRMEDGHRNDGEQRGVMGRLVYHFWVTE